ncbi:hypothetical protein [Dactylosporangium salmoneum]
MPYNAFATVDPQGDLNAYSLVTVDGLPGALPVPESTEDGDATFWPRIAAALHGAGLTPVLGPHLRRGVNVCFNVAAKES